MTIALETIQAEVLRLPIAERAKLLDRLIASLDFDADVESTWDELADNRELELSNDSTVGIPIDLVITRLEARFPG